MPKKTEKIFDKIVKKNFNNELEKILEQKDFEENVKNILLTMLYKIEASYKDYEKVKQNVETKEEFIQNIINIIKNNCNEIQIVKPNTDQIDILENRTFIVNKEKNQIICYPIERKLLYAIAKISKQDIIIKEKDNICNKAISDLINVGNNIQMVEPLRDFNGYSWTTIYREIESPEHNIIYQNLRMLVGYEFLNHWIKNKEFIIDYMEMFIQKLQEEYGKESEKLIIELIKKISILLDVKYDKEMKKEILVAKQVIEEQLNEIENNERFIEQTTNKKLHLVEKIRIIDETINNKELLKEEYIKRNEQLPLEKKIFSMRILSNIMIKEREETILEIEKLNKLLNPQNFVKYKKELKEKDEYLKLIDTQEIEQCIKENIINMQKIFLKCYLSKLEKVETKQEIIKYIYEFRYYCMLPFEENIYMYQAKELEKNIQKVQKRIIQKAKDLKVIQIYSQNENINYEIIKNIFQIRTVDLDELNIKIIKEKEKYFVQIFDEDVFEEKLHIEKIEKKDLEIKLNKKVKIFS